MDRKTQQLPSNVNHAIIKCRGVYSQWAKRIGVNYTRMLVFYTIRDHGYCIQKQIDHAVLPLHAAMGASEKKSVKSQQTVIK